MAAFTASSLKSNTLENAALEIATMMQVAEASETQNSGGKNVAQVSIDTDRKMASITINIPVEISTNATTGALQITAQTYLA